MRKSVLLKLIALALVAVFAVTACGSPKDSGTGADKGGGTLKVVIDASPPTLDSHVSTTTLVYQVGWHIFEGLFTLNDKWEPIPMLVKDYSTSSDGMIYNFKLREGVKFHNGNELTSEDVVASLNRWGQVSGNGKTIFKNIASVQADGKYGVKVTLSSPTNLLLVFLAMPNGGAVIYPKEIAANAGVEPVKEFIGTGPYKFVDWVPNQYIKLQRFAGYQPVDFPATGYGGQKVAYLDEIQFVPIADAAVRVAGVVGKEYHFADFVPVDEYDRLKSVQGLKAVASDPRGWFAVVFNKKEGIMSNKLIRQAFLAALDMGPIMTAGYGHKDFWRLDPSIMFKEQAWWTDAGAEKYNQKNADKAKQLLTEAGYKGEAIRWMTGPLEYNFSLAAKSQLEKAGFNIDLQSMEWATLTDRRGKPELWDAFSTGMTARPDPTQMVIISPTYAGWWENNQLKTLTAELTKESDFNKRYRIWQDVQKLFYDEVPAVKIGDYANLRIYTDKLNGFANKQDIFFWNVRLEK
ncbi:MAG: ABC transporter substrate-binding protein [Bacillota bacterium]